MKKVPQSLRTWFLIHFIVDMFFAIPLIFFPEFTLSLFGLKVAETVTPRLVGAALVGIGGASFANYKGSFDSYKTMINLKILWSGAAILGLILALIQGAPKLVWLILLTFAIFSGIWIYYRQILK